MMEDLVFLAGLVLLIKILLTWSDLEGGDL